MSIFGDGGRKLDQRIPALDFIEVYSSTKQIAWNIYKYDQLKLSCINSNANVWF